MIPLKDNIPTDRFPIVTVALILANVVVYLLSIRHGGSLISGPDSQEVVKYGATPYALTHSGVRCGLVSPTQLACGHGVSGLPAWQTVFTAMFMHASILHIAGNMLFLWIFGNNVEDSMGPIRFLIFYLLGGVAALALQVAVGPNTAAPTLGASGAIAGAGAQPGVHHLLLRGVRAAGAGDARPVVCPAGGVRRRRPHQPDQRRRGGLLRPRRRLRVRVVDDPAGGHAAQAHAADQVGIQMRFVLLALVVAFTVLIGVLTALDMIHHGVNWLDVLAILIVIVFGTGIVGALVQPPRR
jgi:membrane associated rhomboid family serine protease